VSPSPRAFTSGLRSLALLALLLAAPAWVEAVPNTIFNYQGELKDDGAPVVAADARMMFRLWDSLTGGSQIGVDPSGGTNYQCFPERQMLTARPLAVLGLNFLHGGDSPCTPGPWASMRASAS